MLQVVYLVLSKGAYDFRARLGISPASGRVATWYQVHMYATRGILLNKGTWVIRTYTATYVGVQMMFLTLSPRVQLKLLDTILILLLSSSFFGRCTWSIMESASLFWSLSMGLSHTTWVNKMCPAILPACASRKKRHNSGNQHDDSGNQHYSANCYYRSTSYWF